jgi:hypothetical protein
VELVAIEDIALKALDHPCPESKRDRASNHSKLVPIGRFRSNAFLDFLVQIRRYLLHAVSHLLMHMCMLNDFIIVLGPYLEAAFFSFNFLFAGAVPGVVIVDGCPKQSPQVARRFYVYSCLSLNFA